MPTVLLIFSPYRTQSLVLIMSDHSTLLHWASCDKHILKVFVIAGGLFIHEGDLKGDYACLKLSTNKW